MTPRKALPVLFFVGGLLLLQGSNPLSAQLTVEAHAGIGYSIVDMEAWSWQDDLEDWSNLMQEGYLQAFIPFGNLLIGGEVGYQYFFWYEFAYDSGGYYTSYAEREASATRVMGVARAPLVGTLFVEAGAGAFLFDGFTDLGVSASIGWGFQLGDRLSIPLKIRGEYILDSDAGILPVGLSVGVSYKAGGN